MQAGIISITMFLKNILCAIIRAGEKRFRINPDI
jgi:hypothetical protein